MAAGEAELAAASRCVVVAAKTSCTARSAVFLLGCRDTTDSGLCHEVRFSGVRSFGLLKRTAIRWQSQGSLRHSSLFQVVSN